MLKTVFNYRPEVQAGIAEATFTMDNSNTSTLVRTVNITGPGGYQRTMPETLSPEPTAFALGTLALSALLAVRRRRWHRLPSAATCVALAARG
jgi:hypothetical protein